MNRTRTLTHALILWALAAALLALGVWLSLIEVLDRNWLARAGCLVVVLGIWSGVGGMLEVRLVRRALEFRRRLALSRARYRYRRDEEKRTARLAEVNDRFDKRVAAHSDRLGFSFGVLEGSLLVTGTLIWGFGDLLKFVAG